MLPAAPISWLPDADDPELRICILVDLVRRVLPSLLFFVFFILKLCIITRHCSVIDFIYCLCDYCLSSSELEFEEQFIINFDEIAPE